MATLYLWPAPGGPFFFVASLPLVGLRLCAAKNCATITTHCRVRNQSRFKGEAAMRRPGIFCVAVVYLAFGSLGLQASKAFVDVNDSTNQASSADYENLEAVLDTASGQIVIEFFPKEAPKHVEYFIKNAREGAYDGTTFHRIVKFGLIQGGDPLTKNPANRARYGTGGLNAGLPDEVNKNKHLPGAVSSVLVPVRAGSNDVKPGSSGAQFFIVLNAGPAQAVLDTIFTVFGRVVEGMDTAARISTSPATPAGVG